MSSPTAQRDFVSTSAFTRFADALHEARRIEASWFRAQAFAALVRYAPDSQVTYLATEAFAASRNYKDAYGQVAVCAWLVRALIERDEITIARTYLMKLLAVSRLITPPPSAVEALYLLLNAVWSVPSFREPTLTLFVETCAKANTWRAGRAMCEACLLIATTDPARAQSVWERMPETRYKRQTRRLLDAGQMITPCPFFHAG